VTGTSSSAFREEAFDPANLNPVTINIKPSNDSFEGFIFDFEAFEPGL
jgi:hypothetical protein